MATDIIARGLAARLTSGPNGTIPEKFLPKFPMDKEMSDTSTNAVENRVIKQYVDNSAGVQPDYNQNDSTARDYIKNRPFYEESSLTEIADFKVISGNLEEEGSKVTVEYNGERSTGTVTGGSLEIRSDNLVLFVTVQKSEPVMANMEFGHKDNYNIKIGDKVIFNGVEYEVKSVPSGDLVGNLYIADGEINFEDITLSSASFLFVFSKEMHEGSYTNLFVTFGKTNIDFNIKAGQTTIKTIDPKFIKDMYYTKSGGSGEKVLVFKGEIDGFAENIPNIFEEGDMVSLKEPEVQLDVSVIAKYHPNEGSPIAYIGNLALLNDLTGGTFPDTKEDYLLVCGYDAENKTSMLIYGNKNCRPPHNIEVYKSKDEDLIVRIPEKYMPENVALKSYVDDAINNAITKTLNTEV